MRLKTTLKMLHSGGAFPIPTLLEYKCHYNYICVDKKTFSQKETVLSWLVSYKVPLGKNIVDAELDLNYMLKMSKQMQNIYNLIPSFLAIHIVLCKCSGAFVLFLHVLCVLLISTLKRC